MFQTRKSWNLALGSKFRLNSILTPSPWGIKKKDKEKKKKRKIVWTMYPLKPHTINYVPLPPSQSPGYANTDTAEPPPHDANYKGILKIKI